MSDDQNCQAVREWYRHMQEADFTVFVGDKVHNPYKWYFTRDPTILYPTNDETIYTVTRLPRPYDASYEIKDDNGETKSVYLFEVRPCFSQNGRRQAVLDYAALQKSGVRRPKACN